MDELKIVGELIQTPAGVLGLVAAALFVISRSNAKLSKALIDQVPKLMEQFGEHAKALFNNTKATEAARSDIASLRCDLAQADRELKELAIRFEHSDQRQASLIARDNESVQRQEKLYAALTVLIKHYKIHSDEQEAARLQVQALGGGSHSKLKKEGK